MMIECNGHGERENAETHGNGLSQCAECAGPTTFFFVAYGWRCFFFSALRAADRIRSPEFFWETAVSPVSIEFSDLRLAEPQ